MKLEPDSTIPRCPNCYVAHDLACLPENEEELCKECEEELNAEN